MVKVYGQTIGLGFRVQPTVHVMQTRSRLLLASPETITITTLVHAGGTELLQMSQSTKDVLHTCHVTTSTKILVWLNSCLASAGFF